MTERNLEARRLIGAQLDELGEAFRKLERRRQSLDTQQRNIIAERARLKDEIAGLNQALEALGGPLPESEPGSEA